MSSDGSNAAKSPAQHGFGATRSVADYLPILAVGLVAFLFQLPFFDRWFNFMDEGHMLWFADLISKGGELYQDATVYPLPGAFYFLAWVMDIFGHSILVSRWLVVVQFSLFCALVFVLFRRLVPPAYAVAAVVLLLLYRVWAFPHWHIYSYSTTAQLVLVVAMLVLLRFFETGNRRVLAASGLVFGLAVLCKQDYGLAGLIAMTSSLAIYAHSGPSEGRRSFFGLYVWFILPAAAVGVATGLYFLRLGLLDDLLQLTVFNHFVGMSEYEYWTFPDLLPLFAKDDFLRSEIGLTGYMPAILFSVAWDALRESYFFRETFWYDFSLKVFYYLPLLFVLGGSVRLWRLRDELSDPERRQRYLRELLIASFFAGSILIVWINRPQDWVHLGVLYWPLLVLSVVYAHALLRGRRRLARSLALVSALPALVVLGYTGHLILELRSQYSELIPGERAGVRAAPTEARMLGEVTDYIVANSAPDDTVSVLPYFPLLNFLADRVGPHRSAYILWVFPEIPNREELIVEAMDAKGTDLVVYNFTQFHSFPPVKAYVPRLFSYLVENFEMERVFTYDHWGYKLAGLRRSREPARGTPLLDDVATGTSLRVESGDGPPRSVPPEERDEYARMEEWPFRPVMALRPTGEGGRTVLSLPLHVPERAQLRTAIGMEPQYWFHLPKSWVRFRIEARDAGRGQTDLLFDRTLNPTQVFTDRGWFELEIDLAAWAGREIVLEFSTEAELRSGEALEMGGWEAPRLVVH